MSGETDGSSEMAPPNSEKFWRGAMNGDGSTGPDSEVEVEDEDVPEG